MTLCMDCNELMTLDEVYFYSTRCERCERLWMVRVEEWRHGRREDPELDQKYGSTGNGGSNG